MIDSLITSPFWQAVIVNKDVAAVAEVVLFTAGLEDYAAPICAALEHRYGNFTAKLYRPATVACDAYPCVKVGPQFLWLIMSFVPMPSFLLCQQLQSQKMCLSADTCGAGPVSAWQGHEAHCVGRRHAPRVHVAAQQRRAHL